jgi:hypothetical protein
MRMALGLDAAFDPAVVPEVQAAYESAEAQARRAAADLKRYASQVANGDVSASHNGTHAGGERRSAGERRAPATRAAVNAACLNHQELTGLRLR